MRQKWSSSLIALALLTFPAPAGYVNDFAGILNNTQILAQQISQFEQETSNEISIVTIETLQDQTIEEYAGRLFEEWQIGKASKDNGVLILIAPNEREVRIEVGYGLEGALPDSLADLIIRKEMLSAFQRGDYQAGVEAGLSAIMQAIKGEYQAEQKTAQWQEILASSIPFLIFIILIIFLSQKGKGKNNWLWFLAGMFFGRGSGGSSSGRDNFSGFGGGSSGGGGASGRW